MKSPPDPQPLGLRTVCPEDFRRWQEESRLIDSMQVVFIVGPQRTGTTWLTQNFQGHPNAASRCEGHSASRLLSSVVPQIRAFNADRPDHAPYCRLLDDDQAMLARQIVDRQLISYIRSAESATPSPILAVIDKTPTHCHFIADLAALYPTARFICCTRDVRDAVVSLYFLWKSRNPKAEGDIAYSARWHAMHTFGPMLRTARAAGARLGPSRYTETAYEDRKADPHAEIERLLRFIGLDASPKKVEMCVAAGDFKALSGRAPGQEAVSHYRKGVVGDWRNHLSPEVGEEVLHRSSSAPPRRGRSAARRQRRGPFDR